MKKLRGEIYQAEKFTGSLVNDEENLEGKRLTVRNIRGLKIYNQKTCMVKNLWLQKFAGEKFAMK